MCLVMVFGLHVCYAYCPLGVIMRPHVGLLWCGCFCSLACRLKKEITRIDMFLRCFCSSVIAWSSSLLDNPVIPCLSFIHSVLVSRACLSFASLSACLSLLSFLLPLALHILAVLIELVALVCLYMYVVWL